MVPLTFWKVSGDEIVEIKLKDQVIRMPFKDKVRLTYLFEQLFKRDSFIYSLVGNKPVSVYCSRWPLLKLNDDFLFLPFLPHKLKMVLGLKVWEKYREHFTSKYLMWTQNLSENRYEVFFINKEEFYQIISKFQADFETVLERKDLGTLLDEGQSSNMFENVLKDHDGLIGTLLGYGRDNAWEFYGHHHLEWIWKDSDVEMKLFCNYFIGNYLFPLPSFAANPNTEESKKLKLDYIKTRESILKIEDFQIHTLESVLQMMM